MRGLSVLALLLVAGCGASAGSGGAAQPCTAIGARVGIGVEVEPGLSADSASLEACWGGSCRTEPVELSPSTQAGETTCSGDQPSDVCSAEVRETGGKHGFAAVPDLPELPIQVTLTVVGGGAEQARQTLGLTPRLVYPNGPDCSAGGPQANLVVDADGHIRERE